MRQSSSHLFLLAGLMSIYQRGNVGDMWARGRVIYRLWYLIGEELTTGKGIENRMTQ